MVRESLLNAGNQGSTNNRENGVALINENLGLSGSVIHNIR